MYSVVQQMLVAAAGINSLTELRADYAAVLKREDEAREQRSVHCFKGLLVSALKNEKNSLVVFKGFSLFMDKWTLVRGGMGGGQNVPSGFGFALESFLLPLDYHHIKISWCVCWWSAVQTKHLHSGHRRPDDLEQHDNLPPKTSEFTRQHSSSTPNVEQCDVLLFHCGGQPLTHQRNEA